MTVMLLVPNPQKIRMALHAQREAAEFPYEETLVTDLDAPEAVPVETTEISESVMETSAEPETRSSPLLSMLNRRRRPRSSSNSSSQTDSNSSSDAGSNTDAAAVRVASADPTASIGYQPFPSRPFIETNSSKQPENPASVSPEEPAAVQIDIPVPEPEHDAPRARVAAAVPTQQPEKSSVQDPLTPVKEPIPTPAAPAFPETPEKISSTRADNPPRAAAIAPAGISAMASRQSELISTPSQAELSTDESMSITVGTQPQRWNFRFQGSELSAVFKVLGQYQGYTVVIDEELNGNFSGQFLDADPAQAFAAIVKSRGCRVSRRGNIILLNQRSTSTYR